MKWKNIAADVIRQLCSDTIISRRQQGILLGLIESRDTLTIFNSVRTAAQTGGRPVGWNKIAKGYNLYGWYGKYITITPLRAVALEISCNELLRRPAIEFLTSQNRDNKPFISCESASITQQRLAEFGIYETYSRLSAFGLKLLRRINADQREQPFVDRWRWSEATGIAQLTDDDLLTITKEAVWARGFDACLNIDGELPESIHSCFKKIEADSEKILFDGDDEKNKCSQLEEILCFYGFSEVYDYGLKLRKPAGEFPAYLVSLYQ